MLGLPAWRKRKKEKEGKKTKEGTVCYCRYKSWSAFRDLELGPSRTRGRKANLSVLNISTLFTNAEGEPNLRTWSISNRRLFSKFANSLQKSAPTFLWVPILVVNTVMNVRSIIPCHVRRVIRVQDSNGVLCDLFLYFQSCPRCAPLPLVCARGIEERDKKKCFCFLFCFCGDFVCVSFGRCLFFQRFARPSREYYQSFYCLIFCHFGV